MTGRQVLSDAYGGGTVTVRLHATAEDRARGFNRTENVRPIPRHASRS
jgi:hypothetical protein